ncbi:MAG: AraC family transcriptional regulator [Ruminiclostridium sp.]|nr:AraC family transcriptional regulator [Ruminiclostridium sp.]
MNEVILSTVFQPVVCACGFQTACEPFCLAERVPEFNELIYVTEGTMYVSEDGTDYEINEGELLFLKCRVRHCGTKETRRGTKWYYARFCLEEPDDDTPRFEPDPAPPEPDRPLRYYEPLPKKLTGLKGGHIERGFAGLADYCLTGDELKRMRINCMFCQLLTDIALAGYTEKTDSSLSGRICSWLEKHYAEPFSADKLEKEFYLSYKRMAAVFKQERGVTMQQYHTAHRMRVAAHLLRSTQLPIGDIANRLGFEDRLYFSRCFHSFSGVSPKEYRHSAKNDH